MFEKISTLLVLLDPGMKLFVPRSWASRDGASEPDADIEMASLAFVHACDLLTERWPRAGFEAGFVFTKRPPGIASRPILPA